MNERKEEKMTETMYKFRHPLTKPVIFAEVMEDPEICRGLLERILPEKKVKELRFIKLEDEYVPGSGTSVMVKNPETEKTIFVGIEAKSVRLDVLFDAEDEWYDIEMQFENLGDLPKRSRYYHAVKTVRSLKRGQDYRDLKPGYVIFICMFDYYNLDQPVYTFEMYDEKNHLKLNDGQVTIFLNGVCENNVPKELKTFYQYLQTGTACEDELIQKMDRAVTEVNQREEVRYKVTLYDEALRMKAIIDRQSAEIEDNKERIAEQSAAMAEKDAAMAADRKLTAMLLELNRIEDLKAAMEDESYRRRLMEELGI